MLYSALLLCGIRSIIMLLVTCADFVLSEHKVKFGNDIHTNENYQGTKFHQRQEQKLDEQSRYKTVRTASGLVQGHLADDGDYFAFLGIPYAAPPTGKNRFKAPLPAAPWKGVYKANKTVKCPQNGEGDEDCLIVNVFTPTKITKRLLPVLVYIHGGSFYKGEGQTKGVEPMTNQEIMVVTLNYRLGVLGFLCIGTKNAPGNAGLKDQLAALRWVQTNIKKFGGDPKNVTLYGTSAGGGSVEFHVLTNQSVNLFHRAVVESGAATAVWATDFDPIITAKEFASFIGLTNKTGNLLMLVSSLRNVEAIKLSVANQYYYDRLTNGRMGFAPCVEKKLKGVETFLTQAPYTILTTEKYKKIPMLCAFTSFEGLNMRSTEYYGNNYINKMEDDFTAFVPADLKFNSDISKTTKAKYIRNYYFGNESIDNDITRYLNYFGDYMILHEMLNAAEIHSRNRNPVYLMEFAYRGNMGPRDKHFDNITSAAHGDMIKHAILDKPASTENDKLAVDRVSQLLGNFVKFGNPTPETSKELPFLWPAADSNSMAYIHLDKVIRLQNNPKLNQKKFWDDLYTKFRRIPTSVQP